MIEAIFERVVAVGAEFVFGTVHSGWALIIVIARIAVVVVIEKIIVGVAHACAAGAALAGVTVGRGVAAAGMAAHTIAVVTVIAVGAVCRRMAGIQEETAAQ